MRELSDFVSYPITLNPSLQSITRSKNNRKQRKPAKKCGKVESVRLEEKRICYLQWQKKFLLFGKFLKKYVFFAFAFNGTDRPNYEGPNQLKMLKPIARYILT
jgi:hypothetical protein